MSDSKTAEVMMEAESKKRKRGRKLRYWMFVINNVDEDTKLHDNVREDAAIKAALDKDEDGHWDLASWIYKQFTPEWANDFVKESTTSIVARFHSDLEDVDPAESRTRDPDLQYILFQKERGEEKNRIHIQGYLQTLQQKEVSLGMKPMLNLFKRMEVPFFRVVNFEPVNNIKAAQDYCGKLKSRQSPTVEYGEFTYPGKRMDLEVASALVKSNMSMERIAFKLPEVYSKYGKGLDHLQARLATYHRQKRQKLQIHRPPLQVYVYYGRFRSGKSHAARAEENHYKLAHLSRSQDWFEGYSGQPTLVIEEFNGNADISRMKEYLDKYDMQCSVKGGHVDKNWNKVIITTNERPFDWWPAKLDLCGNPDPSMVESRMAFFSRITCVYVFRGKGVALQKCTGFEFADPDFQIDMPEILRVSDANPQFIADQDNILNKTLFG